MTTLAAPKLQTRTFAVASRAFAAGQDLPGPCSVVSFGDPGHDPAPFKDAGNVVRRLHLEFHDGDADDPRLPGPTAAQARECLAFVRGDETGMVVCQCDAGVGRSLATAAALSRLGGRDDRHLRARDTHDRRWYDLLLEAGGKRPDPEPLVAIAVRVKYPADRLQLLLLSLQRQRYRNWLAVVVTDGPDQRAHNRVHVTGDARVTVRRTPERKGRWGHPYRQLGLDACLESGAEYVGLTNDDNYYAPGYLSQMVNALEWTPADLAFCSMLHRYQGWGVCDSGPGERGVTGDVGCWLARADLARRVPWPGDDFDSDSVHVRQLAEAAGPAKIVCVRRPLFVKN